MSRLYGDPIQVWTQEGRPVQFLWRDRLHAVRRVLDHWVVAREGWKLSETDPGERRFWRVEADPGTYELRFDTAGEGWLLMRAWD
ncbi:DUF6504 family protein [Streptosporangium sp. NBC_01639]|uniref:DUF6504 family protein n=1 Tax=unclassified Streptosporangium TaxID=2632669 RepID=UPI002DDBFE0F|nr:DUF6504 family protein [Streptosporangium sp. NBC_01756]WSC88229.1 DUF6504 family protein [Streptosporangium sp. NBC_01756]WTD53093.1 DUF6504 family protein [Streptosporangium sp. NBC_01639]